jgi:DNA-binding NarL/FixJ family response regulator
MKTTQKIEEDDHETKLMSIEDERDREILRLFILGLTHKKIGCRVGLAKSTVSNAITRIRKKYPYSWIPNKTKTGNQSNKK